MTQAIIDNAAAISFDRDTTIAQTISPSRNLKYFRKGPIQGIVQVQMNVITRATYQPILAALSSSLVGPYTMTLPSEVVGSNVFPTSALIMGAGQTGSNLIVDGMTSGQIVPAGTLFAVVGANGSYVTTANATVNSSGVVTLPLDQPIINSPADNVRLASGSGISLPYYLIERPRASFGPTGLVNHDGAFVFAEILT